MSDLIKFHPEETKQTMSSLDIAQVTGKDHKNVMQSIRNMEPAWEKISGLKFQLAHYSDAQGKPRPCYYLNKRECLYIATKFNDEARAKLILRWEELEMKERTTMTALPNFSNPAEAARAWAAEYEQKMLEAKRADAAEQQVYALSQEIEAMQPKVSYYDTILASKETVTTTQVAQDYGMSAIAFNRQLSNMRIQHKVNGQWILYAPYISQGYVHSKQVDIVRSDGRHDTKMNTEWTQKGRLFLYETLKKSNIIPLIEQ
jgi:Rha family phage regulatory protein